MANVTLRNVRKTYPGGFEAIKGVNVDVADGQRSAGSGFDFIANRYAVAVVVEPQDCKQDDLFELTEISTSGHICSES